MRALTVIPGLSNSGAISRVPEPSPEDGALLAQTLGIDVCGTDVEIVSGRYGSPPPGRDHLIIGHESIGKILEAPEGSGFSPGDLVVGVVRRPDPVPCAYCAIGEWDMCRNGQYTERGIKQLDGIAPSGFASSQSLR